MAKKVTPATDEAPAADDMLVEARKQYEAAREYWSDNHLEAKEDLKFARLGQQWDERIKQQRELEQRPCLTFNKMPAFIRQVVNDARQNKPSIKVHPQDSGSDPHTAEILNGLIRNIEVTSDADVATDTAIESAVDKGFGFWRINTAYTTDDAFEQDIVIERIANPFTVYGDPRSTAADSSDWNVAFVVTTLTKDEFEAEYPDAEKTDWEADFRDSEGWIDGDNVVVAEWWTREKVKGAIVALSDGSVMKLDEYEKHAAIMAVQPVGEPREVESFKVTQRIVSGAEVLKTVKWPGKYIPIVPVYGDEVIDEDGKRHFRSLIRDAKSAQQMFNYWRTTTTELIALAPKAPFIGEEKAFEIDPNWQTANSQSHAYLMVPHGVDLPQRQPFAGVPAGALQEALNAADDMKSIIGIYDASLGAKSNETSGKAIMARQREGDVSTFHFIDNLSRAIRHSGRILLDLIPKVYTTERMIRILGEDMQPASVQLAPGQPPQPQLDGSKLIGGVFDITAGKYDLTVAAGPSFTSRREEVMQIMTEWAQAGGEAVAGVLAPRIAKLLDIPDADQIGEELKAALNPQGPQVPPEMQEQMQAMQQHLQEGAQAYQQLEQQLAAAKANDEIKRLELGLKAQEANKASEDRRAELALKAQELELKRQELAIKQFEANTDRIQATKPEPNPQPPSERAAA
jgi:hypothetical protein